MVKLYVVSKETDLKDLMAVLDTEDVYSLKEGTEEYELETDVEKTVNEIFGVFLHDAGDIDDACLLISVGKAVLQSTVFMGMVVDVEAIEEKQKTIQFSAHYSESLSDIVELFSEFGVQFHDLREDL